MPLKTHHNRSGFSLIEIMVAVTIFALVMMVSTSAVLTLIEANRKAQSIKSVVNNLNFAIESISRNIRVGTHFRATSNTNIPPANPSNLIERPNNCDIGCKILYIEPQHGVRGDTGDQLIYLFEENYYPNGNGAILRQIGNESGDELIALTAPEVDIQYMRFYVDGAQSSSDGVQPRVRMVVKGNAQVGREGTEFSMQTAVTQRVLDI